MYLDQYNNARESFMNMGTIDSNPNKPNTIEYNIWNHYFNGFMNWFLTSIPVNITPV